MRAVLKSIALNKRLIIQKSVDISGECSNPMISITPRTDYVNCRVVNQRRLDVRGAVTSRVKVTGEKKTACRCGCFRRKHSTQKKLSLHIPQKDLWLQSV